MYTHEFDGYTLTVTERENQTMANFIQYSFTLKLPDGSILFDNPDAHFVGIMYQWKNQEQRAIEGCLAYAAITKESGVDEDFYKDHTPAELAWLDTFACQEVHLHAMDLEDEF